ncbi:MFS transporter [Aliiglaciecola sp. LCG003]|uniref:MFS transporter n=1 Tax=Aliiglaciecola sp. LCG003 TaxID=3053655 RepID=UPI002572B3F7|nr:MFS transporter [Aliiglaciecola sp. LCG003]WJG11306.1 MFS transporter [Aliiglaciecola sp. LCG003]
MSRLMTIVAIAACYFTFAILLNSVGPVILQSINSFDISKPHASTLEGFKDLSIALVSFVIASFIPRIGYKIALLAGLLLVLLACLVTPLVNEFVMIQVLFACIGTSFALVKVSVYSIIGQLSHDAKGHASLLNTIEGIFMLGVLSGYWVFSSFIGEQPSDSAQWLNVYFFLAFLIGITIIFTFFAPIEKPQKSSQSVKLKDDFLQMIKLAYKPLVLIFVLSIFLYVLVEQGIGTWLPTFNNEILHLPVNISIQVTSLFAASIAVGRLLAGQVLRVFNWYGFLNVCLLGMAILMLLILPLTKDLVPAGVDSIWDAPLAAYILPLIGLLMAPIYPILNSVMLSSLNKSHHAAMTGLIVVFSALGGTTGSILTGYIFDIFGGQNAFYSALIPMLGIALSLYFFRRKTTPSPT